MQVIFTEPVPGVAAKGDMKNVKDGFYRNFLLPQRKAVPATPDRVKEWEERRKQELIEKEQFLAQAREIQRRLSGLTVKVAKKVTKKKTLYGGVKAQDVVDALQAAANIAVPLEAVKLPDHLKTVGSFNISLHIAEGVDADITLEVVEKS